MSRLAAHRSSSALKPSVWYGMVGKISMSFGMTVSWPAAALDATPVSTKTQASMSCHAMDGALQISSSSTPMYSIIHSGVTTRHASVMLMEHISRKRTNSSHSKFGVRSGSTGYRTARQCALTMFSMCGIRAGFSSARLWASCSGPRPRIHVPAGPPDLAGMGPSSSKGSSSSATAPRYCESTAYQKSSPHLARSVCRSAVRCRATSARSDSVAEEPDAPPMPLLFASLASATTSLQNMPPSSPTRRPRTEVRMQSSESCTTHASRCGCVSGSSWRPPATAACATSSCTARACGVASVVSAWASLSRSAQARQSSRWEVPTLLMVWAATFRSGSSLSWPWRTKSDEKPPPPPPAPADLFCARSVGLACWRCSHLVQAVSAANLQASLAWYAFQAASSAMPVCCSMLPANCDRRCWLTTTLRFAASSGMTVSSSRRDGTASMLSESCRMQSGSHWASASGGCHSAQSTSATTICLRTAAGPPK
mmetsp:Transcript_2712/g.7455  ORF Transcript_2712/g.7455 Transcript_2712/m.7455 type:complete len:482 (+) Transcript_2712:1654-3099(+)